MFTGFFSPVGSRKSLWTVLSSFLPNSIWFRWSGLVKSILYGKESAKLVFPGYNKRLKEYGCVYTVYVYIHTSKLNCDIYLSRVSFPRFIQSWLLQTTRWFIFSGGVKSTLCLLNMGFSSSSLTLTKPKKRDRVSDRIKSTIEINYVLLRMARSKT